MDTRKTTILELLQQHRQVSVADLASRFVVSEMTIRRDLDELQQQGYLVRTHGGAISTGRLRFMQVGLPNYEVTSAKSAIGKLAASMIEPGETIMVDTGTTALEVARNIPQDQGITVVTTSLCVAQELYGTETKTLLLGGFLRNEFPSVYGPLTEKLLNDIHVDTLFIGCDGADSKKGFYSDDMHISSLERAMIEIANRIVVVTESRKFGQKAFARYALPQDIDILISDPFLKPEDATNLQEHEITIMTI